MTVTARFASIADVARGTKQRAIKREWMLSRDGFGNKKTGTSLMKHGKNISTRTGEKNCDIGNVYFGIMRMG